MSTTSSATMKHHWFWLLAPLALIAGCGSAAPEAVGTAGRAAVHEQAARTAAEAAAEANRDGTEVVMRSGQRELRAPVTMVEADGADLISPYVDADATLQQVYTLIDAGCQLNDLVELAQTDDPQEQAQQIAAMHGLQAAAVLGLANDVHDAKDSGDTARVLSTYALCQYVSGHA